MTIARIQKAAALRGMTFTGEKKFRNTWAGFAYEIFSPSGQNFIQSDTLSGIYEFVMHYPKI
jgi:hypothetical protein